MPSLQAMVFAPEAAQRIPFIGGFPAYAFIG
jgi:hypothetical protein